jgi:hypothetical protein
MRVGYPHVRRTTHGPGQFLRQPHRQGPRGLTRFLPGARVRGRAAALGA